MSNPDPWTLEGLMALRREMANPHLGGSVGLFQQIPTNPRRTP